MMTKKLYRGVLLLLAAAAVGTAASAAQPGREPTNLTADSLTYDTRTGVVTAEANVRMEQGTGWVEGVRATYNTRTEEGTVEGGVRAMREDMQLSCDRLFAQGQNHWQATGSVRMVKADRTFTGPQADYYPAQNDYLLAASGGTITSADGTLSADRLEGWLKENRLPVSAMRALRARRAIWRAAATAWTTSAMRRGRTSCSTAMRGCFRATTWRAAIT